MIASIEDMRPPLRAIVAMAFEQVQREDPDQIFREWLESLDNATRVAMTGLEAQLHVQNRTSDELFKIKNLIEKIRLVAEKFQAKQ